MKTLSYKWRVRADLLNKSERTDGKACLCNEDGYAAAHIITCADEYDEEHPAPRLERMHEMKLLLETMDIEKLQLQLADMTAHRDRWRYSAKILKHAYEHDNRPPYHALNQPPDKLEWE